MEREPDRLRTLYVRLTLRPASAGNVVHRPGARAGLTTPSGGGRPTGRGAGVALPARPFDAALARAYEELVATSRKEPPPSWVPGALASLGFWAAAGVIGAWIAAATLLIVLAAVFLLVPHGF